MIASIRLVRLSLIWLSLSAVTTVLAGLTATPVRAEPAVMKFEISAGKFDRFRAPVSILVDSPGDDIKGVSVKFGRNAAPAQLTKPSVLRKDAKGKMELHFIVPYIEKGNTITAVASFSKAPSPGHKLRWRDIDKGDSRELQCKGCHRAPNPNKPYLRYMYAKFNPEKKEETYKVFHHVMNSSGRAITKGAGGKYTHHRGLFYGFMRTTYDGDKVVDTWHCKKARLEHAGFIQESVGSVVGRHAVNVNWVGQIGGDKVFAKEIRELTVYPLNRLKGMYVDVVSELKSTGGKVKVDGDPQHAGFQFRAAQAVAEDDSKNTTFLRPDGPGKPGETRNWPDDKKMVNLPWNTMNFTIGGKQYGALYVASPANPGEARYSERSYGRFGAYFTAEFDEKKPLLVRYRMYIQEERSINAAHSKVIAEDFANPMVIKAVK